MQGVRELRAWQRAHELVLDVYRLTRSFPPEERYGLTSQLRRAATSVASNIVEGCGRPSDRDFRRFVGYAVGSSNEVEYQLLLSRDLGWLSHAEHAALAERVIEARRMLVALVRKLDSS
jgi:four helix bundle protein